jgi:ABC-type bacteriocin/lantibiotic exporter with double-glycine peptidase domain
MSFLSRIKKCFLLLQRQDRFKLVLLSASHVLTALLDLLGVAILGLLGSLAIYGVQSRLPEENSTLKKVLDFFGLGDLSFQSKVVVIAIIAASLLVIRTFCSAVISWRIFRFLAFRAARLSADLIKLLFETGITRVRKNSTQQNIYAVTTGVNQVISGVVGAVVGLFAEVVLILVLGLGLVYVNPNLAIAVVVYFSLLAIILHFLVGRRIDKLAQQEAETQIRSNEMFLEVISFYKELFVKGRRSHYSELIAQSRFGIARAQARLAMMPNISKYVFETGLVLGGILVSGVTFLMYDANSAVGILSLFLVSAVRIAPAILRIQTGLASVKQSLSAGQWTLDLAEEVRFFDKDEQKNSLRNRLPNAPAARFRGAIEMKQVKFSYGEKFQLEIDNVFIPEGSKVWIKGKSGMGKTTLIDLMLGILIPNSGTVLISDHKPSETIKKWPGEISYVAQEVFVSKGSIRDNLSLGYDRNTFDDEFMKEILGLAQLHEFFNDDKAGLDTMCGERGLLLSGGQRQRLGIARGLMTNPSLIIFDEMTSSLDNETAEKIVVGVSRRFSNATILFVSHRRNPEFQPSDIIEIAEGRVRALKVDQSNGDQ